MQNFTDRKDVPKDCTWDLSSLFKSDEDFKKLYDNLMKEKDEILKYKGKLGSGAATFNEFNKLYWKLARDIQNILVYSNQRKDENTRLDEGQTLDKMANLAYSELEKNISFVVPEIIALGKEKMLEYMEKEPELRSFEHHFDDVLRAEKYTLSDKEEFVISSFSEVMNGPYDSFGALNNADLIFPEIKDENGKSVRLSHANYAVFQQSADRNVRKNSYESMFETYKSFNNTITSMFSNKIKAKTATAKLRGFESARHQALFENNIPVTIYDSLIDKVNSRLDLAGRHLEIRKRILGLDKLEDYDINVPLVREVDFEVAYDEAKDIILEAFKPLGNEYVSTVKNAFNERWIDVYETPGKRSGAYSSGSYDSNPYILLNYQDRLDDVFTLAHEMGHSMHSYYTKTQPYHYGSYSIFMAEIASTFNECLLNHYLIKKETDKNRKLYLVDHFLDTIRGTMLRQTQFAEFEREVYAISEAGGTLTPNVINSLYRNINSKYYPGTDFSSLSDIEWSRIPHFYFDFYVFQYATGISAALSLSKRVLDGEDGALEKYFYFLKAGKSDYAVNILKKAGVDMEEGGAISEALDVYEKYLDMMEELI